MTMLHRSNYGANLVAGRVSAEASLKLEGMESSEIPGGRRRVDSEMVLAYPAFWGTSLHALPADRRPMPNLNALKSKETAMSELLLKSRLGADARISDETITALQQGLRGRLASAGSDDYDQARTIWNAMNDRRPGLAVRCADAADVMRAMRFAGEHGLVHPLALRAASLSHGF